MPSITRDLARSLVGQFTAFAAMPQAQEGLSLTIDTLMEASRSESHACAIVREIVSMPGEPLRWPSPDRIRAVAWRLLTDSDQHPVSHCKCVNGWVTSVRMLKGVPYDCASPCPRCRGAQPQSEQDGKSASVEREEEVTW